MSVLSPFNPQYGSNQVLTPSASSATVAINKACKQVRILNTGANIAYVRVYDNSAGTQAATTADCPIAAGMSTTLTKDEAHNALAHISAAGTTLQVMTGEGW